jgi:peptide/nickel transport system permease protein
MTKPLRGAAMRGLIGACLAGGIALAVLLAPVLAPHDPVGPVGEVWAPVSWAAPLGLDSLGRDMLSRLLYGGRITIAISLLATSAAFAIGSVLGFTAAILGGWPAAVLTVGVDAMLAIPPLVSALVVLSVLGTSVPVLTGTIAVLAATRVFRVSAAVGAGITALEFFEAARLRGEGAAWLIGAELVPNAAAPLITEFGLRLCSNFLLVASLSFLGLGIQPPLADWGSMVRDNATAISFGGVAPLFPAAAIALFAIGVNLLVDWGIARQSQRAGA